MRSNYHHNYKLTSRCISLFSSLSDPFLSAALTINDRWSIAQAVDEVNQSLSLTVTAIFKIRRWRDTFFRHSRYTFIYSNINYYKKTHTRDTYTFSGHSFYRRNFDRMSTIYSQHSHSRIIIGRYIYSALLTTVAIHYTQRFIHCIPVIIFHSYHKHVVWHYSLSRHSR